MFDLNKTPTLVEEEVNPQDSGTEKKLQMLEVNSATAPAPKKLTRSSRIYNFDSLNLAPLVTMEQDLPNDHHCTPNLMSNSNHAGLPPHTSVFSEAPATAWRGSSSAVPKHLGMPTTAAGDAVAAICDAFESPLFRHDRVVEVLSRNGAGGGLCGNQNPASPCQTTMDLDCSVVSGEESDSHHPRNSWDNSNSKTALVDLDTRPDERSEELQFPCSPVHQAEAPLHTTLFGESSENLQVTPTRLTPKELEEEQRLREVAFNAAFKSETQSCFPTARCRSCLAFCQTLLPSLQESCGTSKARQMLGDCPPVLRNVADEGRQTRKMARHGPKSKSSEYRGVTFYKRTGRWEAHIWHDGAQVYLGASGTKEEAARAYDQAALVLYGLDVDLNFKPECYQQEITYLYKLSKEQLVIYLRRDSRGFGARAQASYPGVKRLNKIYKATYETPCKTITVGTSANEEDAARAVLKEALLNSHGALVTLILDTHHVRNMPSYAAHRYDALYPEAVEGTQLRNQAKAITSKRPSVPQRPPNPTSTPEMKKHSTLERRQATPPIQDSTSPPVAAIAIPAPLHPGAAEQLPGHKINDNIEVSPSALTPTRSMGAYLEPRTRHQHATRVNLAEAQHLNLSNPHQPSNGTKTSTYVQLLRHLFPKFFRAPAATTASSSCGGPRVPSIPLATGEASSSGVAKFKLFSVEISGPAAQPECSGDK